MKIEIICAETLKKTVKGHGKIGDSGRVYLPKDWIGREVVVCLKK